MNKTILVIAAHPDDEVLGCGGAILRHIKNGDSVHVAILAEGITSRSLKRDTKSCQQSLMSLKQIAQKVHDFLEVTTLKFYNFPDNRMDSVDLLDVVKVVENLIYELNPDIIYTHHFGDLNVDHRIVNNAVVTASRPIPGQRVKTLLFFEVASSTEWQVGSIVNFSPNWFLDISVELNQKLEALKIYSCEMRDFPHSRSIKSLESLAKWRGASVGVCAAEAFILGRNLI